MKRFLFRATILGSCLTVSAATAQVGPRTPSSNTPIASPQIVPVAGTSPSSSQPKSLLDCVAEAHKEAVAAVLKNPTITTKATDDEFTASPKVYDWLLDNPDRVSLAWQRLKVPCVEIAPLGKGKFHWSDDNGSELTWQTVGRFENGVIWYATGKVKPGTLIPSAPVKAVAVVQYPHGEVEKGGGAKFKPTVNIYLSSDSRVTALVMKAIGPAAPKMAEQGAEQLLYFFSGIARHIHKKPEQMEALLAPAKK